MKKLIFGLFTDTDHADSAINKLHSEAGIPSEEISYVYRNEDGKEVSGDASDVATETADEAAVEGAVTGGAIGAAVGLAAAIGLAGPLGPVLAAGPIAAALGLTGAAGAVATGGVVGAATGGLIGALTHLGVSEPKARMYEERVKDGDILVSVHTEDEGEVTKIMTDNGATEIEIVEPTV